MLKKTLSYLFIIPVGLLAETGSYLLCTHVIVEICSLYNLMINIERIQILGIIILIFLVKNFCFYEIRLPLKNRYYKKSYKNIAWARGQDWGGAYTNIH